MELHLRFFQILDGDACIDLGGGDVAMPEQFLDMADVGSMFKEMGGAGMP